MTLLKTADPREICNRINDDLMGENCGLFVGARVDPKTGEPVVHSEFELKGETKGIVLELVGRYAAIPVRIDEEV